MKIKPISEEEIRNNKIQGNLPNRPTQNSLYNTPMTPEEIKATIEDIVDIVNKKLPSFKHVQNVEIRETEFEKNTSRKIMRYKIK